MKNIDTKSNIIVEIATATLDLYRAVSTAFGAKKARMAAITKILKFQVKGRAEDSMLSMKQSRK